VRRILKFGLAIHGPITIATADEPRWLSVGVQPGGIVAWCEATPGSAVHSTLWSYFTGDEAPDDLMYIGTTTLTDGSDVLVVHAYTGSPGHG
jgi:hypothetical protein